MIAKHIPMNSVKKSDFAGLANYITDSQDKAERVDSVTVTNCHASLMVASTDADRLAQAIVEITNTQQQNTRAQSDKTYHLLVSFRAGEKPDEATLRSIESRLCDGLGFGEHQRVSAVHTDTDHLHIHIAINKIHPVRHTLHEPYYPHKTLGKLCTALELEYGLETDNHRPCQVSSENKARDMEHHSGVESLLGWIKRKCGDQLIAATSWAALHQVLADHHLELRERGNGFVLVDQEGLMVKASSVARELSKVKLEEKFGVFNASTMPSHDMPKRPTKKRYEAGPLRSRIDTTALFSQYQKEQWGRADLRARELKVARQRKDRLIADAKRSANLLRVTIKWSSKARTERKGLYSLNSQVTTHNIKQIKEKYQRERQMIVERHRPQQWADWLRRQASAGDSEALAALRARESAQKLRGNTLRSAGRRPNASSEVALDSVTKTGTLIYRVGLSAIRDDGQQLQVSRGATCDGLEAALRMAMERYGNLITVNGTAEFKAQIVSVAAALKLPLNFTDSALESQRLSIIHDSTKTQESRNEATDSTRRTGSDLRESGSTVRLANNQRRHDNAWRQSASEKGVRPLSFDAADRYIEEREQKRVKIFDILIHRRYNENDAGVLSFAGLRRIDGAPLALLKRNDEILVMPVDEQTATHLRRLAIGERVTCAAIGSIKKKGRSR